MTAGHCIHSEYRYRVVLGEYNLAKVEGPEQQILINSEDIFVHSGWDPSCLDCGNDIALIKLSRPAILNDKVQLACLPPSGEALLPVVDYAHCSQPDWWGTYVKQSMVCAGGDIKAACHGDSGGPLNCPAADGRWYVHGVTSFVSSSGCNTLQKPTVFTRVSAFIPWIKQPDTVLPNGYPCYITGWGRISSTWGALHRWGGALGGSSEAWLEALTLFLSTAGGPLPAKLQQALLPVVDYDHCRKPDWWGVTVKQSMVCAGGDIKAGCNVIVASALPSCLISRAALIKSYHHPWGEAGLDVEKQSGGLTHRLSGDSGGPLNCQGKDGRWYVHGIASFVSAMGCNTLRKPTVFTRVSAFDGWILKILRGQ
ncbi:hypothetical protein L345_15018, partial [Ophiophagus hannah]